jgi:hypothetical protein
MVAYRKKIGGLKELKDDSCSRFREKELLIETMSLLKVGVSQKMKFLGGWLWSCPVYLAPDSTGLGLLARE